MVYPSVSPMLTPVTVHQDTPLPVEVWRTVPQHIAMVLMGIVVFTHWITCLVFLYSIYVINSSLNELADTINKLGG